MSSEKVNKKIIYFLDFAFGIGGASKVLLTQAYIMKQRGYEVVIVIPIDEENVYAQEYDEICEKYGLNSIVAKFSVATCMENIDIIDAIEQYNEIVNMIKREKADLLHSTQINVTVEMAARELNIPHLMNLYPADLEEFLIKWIDIYPHYHCSDSIFFSNRWKNGLHIVSRCIRVAYKYSNTLETINKEKKIIYLLSIGVITERKRQLEIIKFVLRCKDNGIQVKLVLLGYDKTSYAYKCKEFVKKNGLEKEIIFQGFTLNIENYFALADLMILASDLESYPGVIVESMANKVPILSTPIAGVPELLQDNYNGFLTKGFQSEDIYEAFERFLDYKRNDLVQNIIDNAYVTYLQNHTYDRVGLKLEEYYAQILEDYSYNYLYTDIDDIKATFYDFIEEKSIKAMSLHTKRNVWFLYHLMALVNNKRPKCIVIWGAGNFGKVALEWIDILNCRGYFIGYIDTYKEGEYLGYPIFRAEKNIIKNCDLIFVAIGDSNMCLESMKVLEQCGKKRNEDYFMVLNNPIRI